MNDDCKVSVPGDSGFSLLEMAASTAILMILMAIITPMLMNQVYATRIRYSTTALSQTLQRARMEAVRKNTFYTVYQTTLATNLVDVFVDTGKTGVLASGDPQAVMGSQVAVSFGPGSGAPGEAAFLASLNFAVAAAGSSPSFNARGLPCIQVGQTCPQTPGQGFVFFVSGINGSNGSRGWGSVAVTPSGRAQVWAYDGTNWFQE